MALKDLFNNFFVVEEEEEVEGPEERESSRSRERVQEREDYNLSLIHISEPTRQCCTSRMPSSA